MDPITMVVGAVLLLVGGLIGRRTKRREKTTSPPSTICGCRHQLAMHDPETNRCHDTVNGPFSDHQYTQVQCGCRQYTGARPIDQFYTPRSLP